MVLVIQLERKIVPVVAGNFAFFYDKYGPGGEFSNPFLFDVTLVEFMQAWEEMNDDQQYLEFGFNEMELIKDFLLVKLGKEPIDFI